MADGLTNEAAYLSAESAGGRTDGPNLRRARIGIALAVAVLFPLVVWASAYWSRTSAITDLVEQAQHRLTIYRANLQSALSRYEHLPEHLAIDPDFIGLFETPDDADFAHRVSRRLEEINTIFHTSAVYLMDRDGLTLAASNWNEELSFVGRNFAFRPYFQQAIAGGRGHYFALGTTSNLRGYYISHPVRSMGEIVGVVIVKVGIDLIERDWANSGETVLVSDDLGIVFLSSYPGWKFRTLSPLDETTKRAVVNSRQYGPAPLTPLQFASETPFNRRSRIVEPMGADIATLGDGPRLMHSAPLPGTGWTMHLLIDMRTVQQATVGTGLVAGFALIIVGLVLLYGFQRQATIAARTDYERRTSEALRRAADQLEIRVRARTKDLEAEIVERQRAEADLRRTQDELVQAGKLAALGQMAAGVTHEMNQPLAAICTYSDNARVLIERERTAEASENLHRISDLTARLATFTGQLKAFARKSEGRLEPVELARAVSESLTLMGAKLKGVEVRTRLGDPDIRVAAETIRLEQVFVNLLGNAVDAMNGNEARRIEIDCETDPTRKTVTVGVRDNGPGLAPEQRAHLFEPFFTTKVTGQGLGLGLSISERIIRDFGGTITADNHPEGGARFCFTLPIFDGGEI